MRLIASVTALVVLAGATGGSAVVRDAGAGPAVTIQAPSAYSADRPFAVSGYLYAEAYLPVIFEEAVGVPDQRIDVLVNDVVAATTTTASDGAYAIELVFGAEEPRIRTIRAVAFRGSAAETSSRSVVTAIDRHAIEMRMSPSGVSIAPGQSAALRAIATMSDGRDVDVTENASWTSSDPSVATVSSTAGNRGRVTASAPGTTTVTATYQGSAATAQVVVTD